MTSCCHPASDGTGATVTTTSVPRCSTPAGLGRPCQVPAGRFLMGSTDPRVIRATARARCTGSSSSRSDRRCHGHQRRVRRVRRRDRPPDRGRTLRLVVRLRRPAARRLPGPAPWPRRRGGARSTAPTGATPRACSPTSTTAATTPSSTSRGTTPWRSARGRAAPAHRGRVGARGARRPRSAVPVGRRARTRRRAPHERLPGRRSPPTTPPPTGTRAPRRSTPSHRTASGCTT